MKICTICSKEQPLSEFQKDKQKRDGHRPDCKVCRKEYYESNKHKIKKIDKEESKKKNKLYYEKNRDRILENKIKYWIDNKDKIYKYVKNNKEYINNRRRKYLKERYKNDALFKLKHNLRVSIYNAFKNGYKKNSRTEEIIGCSYEYYDMGKPRSVKCV